MIFRLLAFVVGAVAIYQIARAVHASFTTVLTALEAIR